MTMLGANRAPVVEASLELPVGGATVVAMRIQEGISRHTEAEIDLASTGELDVEPLLNADAVVVIRRDGVEVRRWSLKVAGGGFTHLESGTYRYRLELRSAFWFLAHTLNTRKFRGLDARAIVAQVLTADRVRHQFRILRTPDVRKYCVQYRESDRNFVERLLELEGIFHFTTEDGVLVLADESRVSADIPGEKRVELLESAGALQQGQPGLHELISGARTTSTRVTLNDFDWKRPSKKLLATADGGPLAAASELEIYDAPGGYRRPDQGELLGRLRLEALRALHTTVEGAGNVAGFAPAHVFELGDEHGDDFAGEHLLVEVEHVFEDRRYGSSMLLDGRRAVWGVRGEQGSAYANRFVAIPRSRPYRAPIRATIPALGGCHTAMVRGPAGEEIHTDRYGRFRGQFHWDREAVSTDDDSRWMRMLQESNSSLFLARVGWEVNVAYIHGDPDRPIGLARDINGVMVPAYAQPAQKNVMTIKTPSSPATGGFNELRLDDSAGSQSFYVQAEMDMRARVKNDMFEVVGNDERHVSGDSFGRSVKRDQSVAIGANATISAGDSVTTRVSKNRTVSIGGSENVVADQGATLSVSGNDTENVGSVRLTIDGSVKPPKVVSLKDLVPDAKAAAKSAGQAALGALKSGGGASGAATAAGGALKGVLPTPSGIASQLTGGLSDGVTLGGLAAMVCSGTINRSATKNVTRTVGGAYVAVAAGSIETSASKLFLETIGGAKITVARGSIDQAVGKAMALTVGGLLMHQTPAKYGVSGKTGTVMVGGTAKLAATDKLEIAAEEVFLTAGARIAFEGPDGSIELTPGSMSFTGDVLLDAGEKLKTTGTPLNLTKAGG